MPSARNAIGPIGMMRVTSHRIARTHSGELDLVDAGTHVRNHPIELAAVPTTKGRSGAAVRPFAYGNVSGGDVCFM